MAPEVCSQAGHTQQADIWSLGITMIEMAEGRVPFSDLRPMQVVQKIIESEPPRLKSSKWSKEFKDFVASILIKDPQHRPTSKFLLDNSAHNFLAKAKGTAHLEEHLCRNMQTLRGDKQMQREGKQFIAKIRQCPVKKARINWNFSTDPAGAETEPT